MTASPRFAFRLQTHWTPASGDAPLAYALTLTNVSNAPVSGFRLCVSGPARIDPAAVLEGATLGARLSNHTELVAPKGFVLAPEASWTVTVRGLSYPLKHWSDGANTAYLAFDDGTTAPVSVAATLAKGQNAPLRKGAERYPVPGRAPVSVSIIPWPAKVTVDGRRPVPAGLDISATDAQGEAAAAAFAELADGLFPAEGLARGAAEGGLPVGLATVPGLAPEAYRISFHAREVKVEATTRSGLLYGLVTLGQVLRGARHYPETFLFPTSGEIADEPALAWRGTHLDVARQFYSSAEVSQFLKLLAWNKMNRFHWHLSDDEAWRVEIDAFPELTKVGAWRGHGLPLPPLLGSGPEPQGGYYTKAAVREIVATADRFGIAVVPEIDVPGHCYALQRAIPALRDPGETGTYYSVQGFPNNCLNPVHETSYSIIETIFDELIELFPAKLFHIGADEVPIGAWSGSPLALDRLRAIGGAAMAEAHAKRSNVLTNTHGADDIEGSGAAALQAEFLRRIQTYLASRGCVMGGWEEAAHGNVIDKSKTYLVGWRTAEVSAALAGQGYDMVVSP